MNLSKLVQALAHNPRLMEKIVVDPVIVDVVFMVIELVLTDEEREKFKNDALTIAKAINDRYAS